MKFSLIFPPHGQVQHELFHETKQYQLHHSYHMSRGKVVLNKGSYNFPLIGTFRIYTLIINAQANLQKPSVNKYIS